MKICMFVRNTFTHDTRVIKEARSLIKAGNEVEVIALRGEGLPDYEIREDKITVRRVGRTEDLTRSFYQLLGSWLLRIRDSLKRAILKLGGGQPPSLPGQVWTWKQSGVVSTLASLTLQLGHRLPKSIGPFYYGNRFLRWLVSIVTLPVFLAVALPFICFSITVKIIKLIITLILTVLPRKLATWMNNGLLFSEWDDEFIRTGSGSGAQVYHAHDLNTLFPAVVVAKKAGANILYDSHELYVDRNAVEPVWRRLKWVLLESQMIRHADEVITVSDSIAEVLAERYKIAKPTVVRNVQEYVALQGTGRLRELAPLQAVDPNDRIAVYAGRITSGRGLGTLVEASKYLERVVIVFLGGGSESYVNELRSMISDRHAEKRVILVPPVPPDEVQTYISSADLGLMLTENVCLSYFYGAGNKLFHYLMAGLPVVVSDQPEKRKIVEEYGVGRVCNPDDPAAVAEAIQQLADDVESRRRYSENALAAARILNWEGEEKKLLEAYQRISEKRETANLRV